MNPATWWATTTRVLRQLVADRRTIGIVLVVPTALLVLLHFVFLDVPVAPGAEPAFPVLAVNMYGIFPMVAMFLVTSITMQRERVTGALERLWTTRLHRADLLFGYAAAFTVIGVLQSLVMWFVGDFFLGVRTEASAPWVVDVTGAGAFVGIALGLVASAFARSEFQAVQFMPVFIIPQLFLCGFFVPTAYLPGPLERIAAVLPMTHTVAALEEVRLQSAPGQGYWKALAVMLAWGIGALVVASLTMPRRTR